MQGQASLPARHLSDALPAPPGSSSQGAFPIPASLALVRNDSSFRSSQTYAEGCQQVVLLARLS